jgi:inositol phosphorylceramide mannosyltransferase catalytic subunit
MFTLYKIYESINKGISASCIMLGLCWSFADANQAPTLPLDTLCVDFDVSMSNHYTPGKAYPNIYEGSLVAWDFCRKLFINNGFHRAQVSKSTKIPKIIHQIWLGSPLPKRFKRNIQSWKRLHPDWQHILWTDTEIGKLKLQNHKLYQKAKNYGERSDIARYEILYHYGGLYVDTDFECIKPFDIFHHTYQFYAGILHAGQLELANGLIGSTKQHPILKICIDSMKDGERLHPTHQTIERTGPGHFLRCFLKYITTTQDTQVIAFPTSFFYCLPLKVAHNWTPSQITPWIRPESFALHYCANSWAAPQGFVYHSERR